MMTHSQPSPSKQTYSSFLPSFTLGKDHFDIIEEVEEEMIVLIFLTLSRDTMMKETFEHNMDNKTSSKTLTLSSLYSQQTGCPLILSARMLTDVPPSNHVDKVG